MFERDHQAWLDTPVPPEQWPFDRPAPDKKAFAAWLEEELGIADPSKKEGLFEAILFSSDMLYRDEKKRPSAKAIRKRLNDLQGSVDDLLKLFASFANKRPLDPEKVDEWVMDELVGAELRKGAPNLQKLGTIQAALHDLDTLLSEANASRDQQAPGRRRDDALWHWIDYLTQVFSISTGQELTVAFHKGEPLTPHARFICKAVEMLDPNRVSAVSNTLKRYRTLKK